MPRFYTHVCSGPECAHDLEGQQFPDLESACDTARKGARALVSQEIASGHNEVDVDFRILDDTGTAVADLPVSARTLGLS